MAITTKSFTFETACRWSSGRSGVAAAGQKPEIWVSSPPEFKGDGSKWSPEELLVAAVESCTMATFLAIANREMFEIAFYSSSTTGLMEFVDGSYRFTRFVVRPTVVLGPGASAEEAFEILKKTRPQCFIANSLRAEVLFEPVVETVGEPVAV